MSAATFFGVKVPVSGGGYFRLFPYWLIRAGLKQINEQQRRPFTFYLHPWEVDPEQPRIKVGALSRFRHYTNLDRCEPRLRQLLGHFEFSTMRNVLAGRGLLDQNSDSSDPRLSSTRRLASDQLNGAFTAAR